MARFSRPPNFEKHAGPEAYLASPDFADLDDRSKARWGEDLRFEIEMLELQAKRDQLAESLGWPFVAHAWIEYEFPKEALNDEIELLEAARESREAGSVGKRHRATRLEESKAAAASDYFRRVLAQQISDKAPLIRPETYSKNLHGSDRDRFGRGCSYKTVRRALQRYWWKGLSDSERSAFISHGINFPPL